MRPAPTIHQDPSAPVTTGLGAGTAIDIRLSSPRGLTPELRAHIDSFKVPAPTAPGTPIAEGIRKGLYQVDNRWYAEIDNHWFRVATDLDGPYVIDEHNKARTAPSIARDARGNWYFDLAPRLKGGMPKTKDLQSKIKQNLEAKARTEADFQRGWQERSKISKEHAGSMEKIRNTLAEYEQARKTQDAAQPGNQ